MIHIADTKVARRYGDFFIRNIHKFDEVCILCALFRCCVADFCSSFRAATRSTARHSKAQHIVLLLLGEFWISMFLLCGYMGIDVGALRLLTAFGSYHLSQMIQLCGKPLCSENFFLHQLYFSHWLIIVENLLLVIQYCHCFFTFIS